MEEIKKLYSKKSIGIATYLGGPLAAGLLIRKNCIALNNDKQGLNALLIGTGSTLLLIAILLFIPERILDKIPSPIIPMIYTGIVYIILEKIQGKEIEAFKENNGTFFSVWSAVGIGLVSSVFLVLPVVGYFYLIEEDWDISQYNAGLEAFDKNESEALKLFDFNNRTSNLEIVKFIDEVGIPNWEQNLTILNSISEIENTPSLHENQISLLKEYSELRLKSFILIKNSYKDFSTEYDDEIANLDERIVAIIDELGAL
jgi:hypothetical protein